MEEKESGEKIVEERTKGVLQSIKKFILNKENFPLLAILAVASIIQIYFFLKTFDQPLWWDEAVYLVKSKALAFGTPDLGVNRGRALFNSFMWAGFFKLGFSELLIKIFQLILSILTVGLTYKLIFNITKNNFIAFFSGFSLAICWVVAYATTRFFPDITGLFLWILLVFLFWKGYAEKTKIIPKYFYWIGPIFVIASYAREMNLMFIGIITVYMLTKEKLSLFKKKEIYILIGIALIAALPFFFYYYNTFGNPLENWTYRFSSLEFNTPEAAADEGAPWGTSTYFRFMPDYFGWVIIILFVLGLIKVLGKTLLGLDLLIKNKEHVLNKYFFLCLWFLIPFIYIAFKIKLYDERYILIIYPAAYAIGGYSLYSVKEYIAKRISKIISIFFIIFVLVLITYPHFNRADNLINMKKESYLQVKQAGLWIKQYSNPGDIILGQSVPQFVYYSEIEAYSLPEKEENMTNEINSKKPKYLVLSIFESHPEWAYSWPQKNPTLVIPVQAYFMNEQQPALVIYQFNYTNSLVSSNIN